MKSNKDGLSLSTFRLCWIAIILLLLVCFFVVCVACIDRRSAEATISKVGGIVVYDYMDYSMDFAEDGPYPAFDVLTGKHAVPAIRSDSMKAKLPYWPFDRALTIGVRKCVLTSQLARAIETFDHATALSMAYVQVGEKIEFRPRNFVHVSVPNIFGPEANSFVENFRHCRNLESLAISSKSPASFSLEWLPDCEKISFLCLGNLHVEDENFLSSLGEMSCLNTLWIDHCTFADESVTREALSEKFPDTLVLFFLYEPESERSPD